MIHQVDISEFENWKIEQIAASCATKKLTVLLHPYNRDNPVVYEVKSLVQSGVSYFVDFKNAIAYYNNLG